MPTTPVFETQRQVLMSLVPQTDYPTAVSDSDPAVFFQLQPSDKNFGKITPKSSDNKDDAHGIDWATEEYLESWDSEMSHDVPVSSERIGRLLYLLFGSVTTTQPAVSTDPLVYRHVFVPQDANVSRQLPVTTLVEIVSAALNRLYPSMALESLTMKGDGQKRVESSLNWKGSGKTVEGSAITAAMGLALMDLPNSLHYFFNQQAVFTKALVGGGSPVDYGATKRLNSWEWGWVNNFLADEAYRPGSGDFLTSGDPTSGAIRSEMLFGSREPSFSFVARFLSQSDEYAALKARTPLDLSLVLSGATISTTYKHKLTVAFPRAIYDSVELGESNGLITCAVKTNPRYNPATSRIITATLDNTVASYTV